MPARDIGLYSLPMSQRHPEQTEVPMFVTTVTKGRAPIFRHEKYAKIAAEHLYRVKKIHPFLLYAFVIMPDHCHFIMRPVFPETISSIMRSYKSGLAFELKKGSIWQPRFYVSIVQDFGPVSRYIHQNPVRANIVQFPEAYRWSSASGNWIVEQLPSLYFL